MSIDLALAVEPLGKLESSPVIVKPASRVTHHVRRMVTSSTVAHGAVPSWFRGVSRMAYPDCASRQSYLDQVAFDQHAAGVLELEEVLDLPLLDRQRDGLREWLRRKTTSCGDQARDARSDPPSMKFSPAASR